jgi:hypothetical protein
MRLARASRLPLPPPPRCGARRARRTAAAVLAGALLAGACTEVGSDPSAAVAIELDPTTLPSIVIGDSLRDSTGRAVPLAARALNSQNSVIPDAPIRFLAIDTGVVAVDSVTGFVVARRTGQAQVIASVGGLQSDRIFVRVTLRPDTVFGADSVRQTMRVSLTGQTASRSAPLRVFVGHDTVINGRDTAVAVPNYLVRFRIVEPTGDLVSLTDTSRVLLTNRDTGRPLTGDTTDVDGTTRRIAVRITTAVRTIPDSVVVEANVSRPDATPVPGSPVLFTIRIVREALLRSSNSPEER